MIGAVPPAAALADALAPLTVDPTRAAVLLDVDGTLAPIVRHADDAHVPEHTRSPLIAVARRYGLVACVSGRRAATARRIVSLGTITYVGNHGVELLRGGAVEPEIDPEAAAWAERVRAFAHEAYETDGLQRLRVRIEDKDVITALHWRGAPDEDAAAEAVAAVARVAQDKGFAVHEGRKVLEIRPPVQIDKGRAVTRLLAEADVDVALYAGDDVTDTDAFAALRSAVAQGTLRQAVCVGVRSDETPAAIEAQSDLLVDGPGGVRDVLATLAGA